MKKKYLIILMIILILTVSFIIYQTIEFLDYKGSLSNLEKYIPVDNEIIIKKLQYNNKNYVISKYYDISSSWSNLNLLLKNNDTYYILKNIKKCDTVDDGKNLYVKDNVIYIHCIGKEGFIDKYLINDFDVLQETINFNFQNTPNISQLHIVIDNVDDEYIYLSSPAKVDNTINDKPNVKCSLESKNCDYVK